MERAEKIRAEGKEIVLVGTAHISKKSSELVKKTIEKEAPDAIGVELDRQRLAQILSGRKWKETDIVSVIKKGRVYLLLFNLLLAGMQKRLGEAVGVEPGQEMRVAVKIATEKGIPLALLDRSISVTLRRALAEISLVEKIKLLFGVLLSLFGFGEKITKEKIEELKKKDVLSELMEELAREMPSLKKVLVDERDLFIANRILAAKGKKIVAVVGAGHVEGIKKYLDKKRSILHLLSVPRKKSKMRWLKFLVPAFFLAIIALALYYRGLQLTLEILWLWILINGSLSALGALLGGGHWKSVLTAFVAAPLTSLHPALAAGWFAGIVEAKVRAPKVKDFEELDSLTLRGFYRNRVSRILLVAAFANAGSMLGTFIALPYALSMLG